MSWLFGIVVFVLEVLLAVVVVYIVAKLAVPDNKYVLLADKYAEIVLAPVRELIKKVLPQASEWRLDIAPYALFLAILIVEIVFRLLRDIFK